MRLHGLVDQTGDDFVVKRFVRKSNAPAFMALTTQSLIVNEHCQTAIPHIYGVGDLVGPL